MIFISAGHYPERPGASVNGFTEHDEALQWVNLLAYYLDGMCTVVPSGRLPSKIEFINRTAKKDDVALEIHFNSAVDDRGVHVGVGSESLYYPGSAAGLDLASRIQTNLSGVFPPNRGAKEGWYRMDPSNGPDYFLSRTRCTAVIIEPEFIQHKRKIQNQRDLGCVAIAEAVLSFQFKE